MRLSWATPLYMLGFFGLTAYFRKSAEQSSHKPIAKRALNGLSLIGIVIFVYFVGQLFGALFALVVPLLQGKGYQSGLDWLQHQTVGQFLLILAVEAATTLLLLGYIRRQKISFRSLGFRRLRWGDIGWVFIGFLIYITTYVASATFIKKIVPSLNLDQSQELGFKDVHGSALVLVFLSLVILPPLVEEFIMRGFLYSQLKKHWRTLWAVVAVSVLFAIAHLQAGSGQPLLWVAAIDTFILSLVLIFVREKSGGLWSSMGLHALKNLIAFLALFVFR